MIIKSELIAKMSKNLMHLTEKDISLGVNHILEQMCATLSNAGRIEIRGFGTFSLHYRPPRLAHNPKTGEKLMTEPKYAVHFKPGKNMREKINASMGTPIIAESAAGRTSDDFLDDAQQ
jgi:integration host factor subunit beta